MTEGVDPEINAMGQVASALAPLDDDQRGRVIRWAAERYSVKVSTRDAGGSTKSEGELSHESDEGDEESAGGTSGDGGQDATVFDHFADLFDAAAPMTDPLRLLVAAYWLQYTEEKTPFFSLTLNKMLKDLGHGTGETSHAMDALIAQKPALILQLKKSGKSRQARKLYKVTAAGKKAVEQMIANGA